MSITEKKQKEYKNHIALKLLDKIKSELSKDGIRDELNNNFVEPMFSNIYDKIFPHYITLLILLIIIVILLLLILTITIQNKVPFVLTNKQIDI